MIVDILFLAFIAGFIVYRLYSAFGKETEDEEYTENVIYIADKKNDLKKAMEKVDDVEIKDETVAETIAQIKKLNPRFTVKNFIEGAKIAFEMVLSAFAKGDKNTLKTVLSAEVCKSFIKSIDDNEKLDEKEEHTLVSIISADIKNASLDGNMAYITTEFETEQITVVKNKEGEIVGGNASQIHNVKDIWTFCRDITALNPNWKLVETS